MQKTTLLICLVLLCVAGIFWYVGSHDLVTTVTALSGSGGSVSLSPTSSVPALLPYTTTTAVLPVSPAAIQTKTTTEAAATAVSSTPSYTVTCLGREILCGDPDNAICINPSTDPSNCGGCGLICGNDQSCTDGTCVIPTTPVSTPGAR